MLKLPDFYNQKHNLFFKTRKISSFKNKIFLKNRKQLKVFLPNINKLKKNYSIIKNLLFVKKLKIQKRIYSGKIFKYWFSNKIARGNFAKQIPKHISNKRQKYFYLKKKMKNYIKQSKLKKKFAFIEPKRENKTKLFLKKYALFKKWKFLNKKQRYQKKIIYSKNIKRYKNTVDHMLNINKNIFLKKIIKKYGKKK